MQKADAVYAQIIEASPTTQDPYHNRARLNRYIPGEEAKTAELFQQFIDVTMAKGDSEVAKPLTQTKLADVYPCPTRWKIGDAGCPAEEFLRKTG